MKKTFSNESSLIENNDDQDQPQFQTLQQKPEGKRRLLLYEQDHQKINKIIEKTTALDKNQIINFEEVSIRRSLFFRLYVAGTIEYGNVIFPSI